MKKRFLCIIFVIALCIASLNFSVSAIDSNVEVDTASKVEAMYKSIYFVDDVSSMTVADNVRIQKENAINNTYGEIKTSISKSQDLNDLYAGSFFDGENLIVQFTQITNQVNSFSQGINGDVVIATANFSLKYLTNCYESLGNIVDKIKSSGISSFYVDEKRNAVVITMLECKDDVISTIKQNATNADCIVFESCEKPIRTDVEGWRPGRGIYIYTVRGSSLILIGGYSTGYMASKGSNPGFVTSAHGNNYGDLVFYSGLTQPSEIATKYVGQITARELSQYVDAAFVQLDTSKYEQSNLVYWTSSQAGVTRPGTIMDAEVVSVSSITTSTWIYKSGMTTYLTIGEMISPSVSIRFDDIGLTISGLIKTNITADHGDSGAISYVIRGANYRGKTLGIVEGGDGTYTYLVPATTINSRLGLTIN